MALPNQPLPEKENGSADDVNTMITDHNVPFSIGKKLSNSAVDLKIDLTNHLFREHGMKRHVRQVVNDHADIGMTPLDQFFGHAGTGVGLLKGETQESPEA